MIRAGFSWLALACATAQACGALPEIAVGECGNRVIEAGETCDGIGQDDARCRPPGVAGQCQLDCSERSDGTRPACPWGYGCDDSALCRKATGTYSAQQEAVPGNAFTLISGDFDGDGRADVLSHEATGPLGATKFRVQYWNRDGSRAGTWTWPRSVSALAVAPVSSDRRSDVVFTDARVGVLLGQRDRTLISETYPTYVVPDTHVRIAGALVGTDIGGAAPLLVLADSQAGGLVVLQPDGTTATLQPISQIDGSVDELAGDPAIGDLFAAQGDDPCLDMVIAVRGAPAAFVYSVCTRDPETGGVLWRAEAGVTSVQLPAADSIDRGPLLGDLNGDGHLDLLLGGQDRSYVAFGDGYTLSPARLWTAQIDGSEAPVPMPLAAGDFTGDGAADLVFPSGFLISDRDETSTELRYTAAAARFGAAWTEARVADLNGNGLLDVIAASNTKLDIDFFNGTGSAYLNPFVIPTERPVEHLAVGDFDGDLIDDLAFMQLGAAGEQNEAKVAFGATAGPPALAVTAARATGVMQIGALDNAGADAAAELFLAYTLPNDHGGDDSAFAWLTGFDRSLMCLVELTTFASDGSIMSVPGLALALGAFEEPGRVDAMLLSSSLLSSDVALWWMPDLSGRNGRPQLLGWGFDPRLEPLRGLGETPQLELLMAAGDLDGDDVDEVVLASPDAAGEHCYIASARVVHGERAEIQSSSAIQIEPACARGGQLAIQDLDADGANDLLLLTGVPGSQRSLIAFWNDGTGGFSEDGVTTLSEADSPEAFALYQPTDRDPLRLAYVTQTRLRVLRATPRSRDFEPIPDPPQLELRNATGIAAGDVDGDGITDLLVADSGNLQLLRAGLEQ